MTAVDAYRCELDAALRGPRRRKRDLLDEAHDHLVDATEAYEGDGLSRAEAERCAVREFGDIATVAPAYQAILSVDRSRRLGIWLFVVVLAQPFAWGAWNASADSSAAPGSALNWLDEFVELAGLATMLFATLAVIGTGIGLRLLGVREWLLRSALTSALVSSLLLIAVSVVMFTLSGATVIAAGFISVVVWIPMAAIATASVFALREVDAASELVRSVG